MRDRFNTRGFGTGTFVIHFKKMHDSEIPRFRKFPVKIGLLIGVLFTGYLVLASDRFSTCDWSENFDDVEVPFAVLRGPRRQHLGYRSVGVLKNKFANVRMDRQIHCHLCNKSPAISSKNPRQWLTHHIASWCEVANPRRREMRETREARKKARNEEKHPVLNTTKGNNYHQCFCPSDENRTRTKLRRN
jgi:hypothetical protein